MSQEIVPFEKRYKNFAGTLEQMKGQLAKALPKHLTPDKMVRIVLTAVQKTPKLLDCTRESVLGAIVTCSQLGLSPDGVLGEAYLIPFKDQCQLIIGYQGLMKLARQSGQVSNIYAFPVHEGDEFRWSLGLDPDITHVPSDDPERESKEITHVYAVAKLKDGGTQFVVMTKHGVDKMRARSRASGSGPWVTDYVAMALKTGMRQLSKWIPKSVEDDRFQRAVALDELGSADLPQGLEGVVVDVSEPPAVKAAGPTLDTLANPAQQDNQPGIKSLSQPTETYDDALARATKVRNGTEGAKVAAVKQKTLDIQMPPAQEREPVGDDE
jgi:recombination protein RecT